MAKPRLEKEWKLWVSCGVLLLLVAAYLYYVSRPPTEGGEPLWKVIKVVDGDVLTLKGSGKEMQVRLVGLIIPDSEKEVVQDFLTKALINQWVRFKPLRDGPQGVKEGFVLLAGEDLHARLVRQGMAQVDKGERGFDIRPYLEQEREAQREKRGLWSRSDQGAK
jgi:endonuclease YncB( thermonuclease family)